MEATYCYNSFVNFFLLNMPDDPLNGDTITGTNCSCPCVLSQVAAGKSVARVTLVNSSFSSSTPPPAPVMLTLEELDNQEVQHCTACLWNGMTRDVAILWNITLSDIKNNIDQPDACMVV